MKRLSLTLFSLCLGSTVSAAPITYTLKIDTSAINGVAGSIDFNFNPGPLTTQTASLQLLTFAGNGAVSGSPSLSGDVTGALPGTLSFDNGTAFNDYFQRFTFGSILSFDVSLFGPALSSPDGISQSGTTFAFSMFSDAAGTKPALTTDAMNGFAFLVNVNLDGTTTVTNFIPSAAVPEPGTCMLLTIAWALGAIRFLLSGGDGPEYILVFKHKTQHG